MQQAIGGLRPKPGVHLWLLPVAAVGVALARFWPHTDLGNLAFLAQGFGFFATSYLFFAVLHLTFVRRSIWVVGWLAIGLLISLALSAGGGDLVGAIMSWLMVTAIGLGIPRLHAQGWSRDRSYIVGMGIVAVATLAWLAPHLSGVTVAMTAGLREVLSNAEPTFRGLGYEAERAEQMAHQIAKAGEMAIRLVPISMILFLGTLYSLGVWWFFDRHRRSDAEPPMFVAFLFWQMPFAALYAVIPLILVRFFLPDPAALVADNVLAGLAFYYILTGLSLLEFLFRHFKIPWYVRLSAFVLLLISGLVGLLVALLLGLVDSFAGWRGRLLARS